MVNYLAVLVAGIAAMVLGYLWYGPLFGKIWMKINKIKKQKKKSMTKEYLMAFIKTLIMAYVLAIFIELTGAALLAGGLIIGFWVWLGFLATVTFSSVIWGKRPFKSWLLDNSFNLLSVLLMAGILVLWV